MLLLSPYYRRWNWGTKRLHNVPTGTQLTSSRVTLQLRRLGQSTWVSLPCYTLWSLPMGFKHTPIFFFLNVFIASNHVYDIQYTRNLEKCNEDWIFLCIKSKIFWQFCRSETIRVTSCVYFSDSRVTIHRAAFRLLYVTRWLLLAGKASTGGVATAMMKSTPVKNSPEV